MTDRSLSRTLSPRAFAWLCALAAAAVAALVSHVAIDIVANFVVAHDPYDDIEHGSRLFVVGVALTMAFGAAAAVVWAALVDFRLGESELRSLIARAVATSPWRFAAAVAPAALAVLVSMEMADALATTGRFCGLEDALGGSIPLGIAIVVAVSTAVALLVRWVLDVVDAAHRSIASAVGALLVGACRPPVAASHACGLLVDERGSASVLARRFGKRAPPLPA